MDNLFNQILINGSFLNSVSEETLNVISPINNRCLTSIPLCNENDLSLATKSARRAFESGNWKNLAPTQKKKTLLKLAELLDAHKMELAYLESIDTGKPIKHSLNIDVPLTIDCIRWYAELADKMNNRTFQDSQNNKVFIESEPIGVVAAIIPWNFPLYIAALKLAPALITGNSVIIKPSEKASLSLLRLGKLVCEAGIPEGVFNILTGGDKLGELIGLHSEIDCITFTGSTKVGKLFLKYSALSNMKKIFLECGGKSPCIILDDYKNLQDIAKQVAFNIFFNQGAVCGGPSRILIEHSIAEKFTTFLIEESKAFIPDDPLNDNTNMGAIIDKYHMDNILNEIQLASSEGAEILCGGEKVYPIKEGFYINPTILTKVEIPMSISKKEVFGPVISIETISSLNDAIRSVNTSNYGLTASIFSQDLSKAFQLSKNLNVGTVSINKITDGNIRTPFGGFRQSGIGRDRSHDAIYNYCETKTTWLNIDLSG